MDIATASPTTSSERILALDTIRGFAVMGILLMNIVGMGLPSPAYVMPTAEVGGNTGANLWAWIVQTLFFEGTMRGLFTLLFGAGVILYTSRLERAGLGLRTADYYFRRNLWLVVFGLINAWVLLWLGDILYFYGITALVLFAFRDLPVRKLLLCAVLASCVQPLVGVREYYAYVAAEQQAPTLLALEEAKAPMTGEQEEMLEIYQRGQRLRHPDLEKRDKAVAAMRGGYVTAAERVHARVWTIETEDFARTGLWECLGMMLLGMALYKTGALTLGWTTRAYLTMLAVGYGLGLGVNALEIRHVIVNDFAPRAALLPLTLTYDLGRIPTTLGHVALAMLVIRSGAFRGLLSRFAATGQMALTNYLMQSVIALLLFTGLGLGWYGQLQRYELYYVVLAIWAVELAWSPWWLARYNYGPIEWLWRSLTRWERQPMRKGSALPGGAAVV